MNCANIPATGGSNITLINLISTNLQPNMPISRGSLVSAHRDHAVIQATIVPMPAPDLNNPAAIGMLINGPPGVSAPAAVPRNMPFMPDYSPIQADIIS